MTWPKGFAPAAFEPLWHSETPNALRKISEFLLLGLFRLLTHKENKAYLSIFIS